MTTAANNRLPLGPPRGMRDFYPEDMAVRSAIFEAWHTAAQRFGFVAYDACVVESLDLLRRKAGEDIVRQIYAFQDKSGRELALRPEMTPTLARMVAARQESLAFPLKWYTIAQCFRYERMTRGRKREHYQWNLDIIGESEPTAEVEVLAAAFHALDLLQVPRDAVRVRFSSRALLSRWLTVSGVSPATHTAVFVALDRRGKVPETELTASLEAAGLTSGQTQELLAVISGGSLSDLEKRIGPDPEEARGLRRFCRLAEAAGLGEMLVFDPGIVRGLAYYTGLVFEAFDAQGALRAIFGGGRYDHLLGDLGGRPTPGVGLGFGDVVITELLQELGIQPGAKPRSGLMVGYFSEEQTECALRVAATLRARGTPVDLALRPEKARAFFGRAGRSRAREALYIGPDDLARGTLRIKDLETRTEREVPLATLLAGPPWASATAPQAPRSHSSDAGAA